MAKLAGLPAHLRDIKGSRAKFASGTEVFKDSSFTRTLKQNHKPRADIKPSSGFDPKPRFEVRNAPGMIERFVRAIALRSWGDVWALLGSNSNIEKPGKVPHHERRVSRSVLSVRCLERRFGRLSRRPIDDGFRPFGDQESGG